MKLEVLAALTPEQIAEAFCELDDDAQAKFFVEVARLAREWGAVNSAMQPHYIGRHLRDCECSTDDAREFILAIAYGMQASK